MTTARGKIDRESVRAHDQWLRRSRNGEGQLDVAGIDASGADLQAAKLAAAAFQHVDLRRANLDYADLSEAELNHCNLELARINSTQFDDARITGCNFTAAAAAITKLDRATVYDSRFDRAKLHGAQWRGARVTATSFSEAEFGNATFDRASFVDCDFRGAALSPRSANPPQSMHGATFENCDFRDADFTFANISGATFIGCKFAGARGEPRFAANVRVTEADVTDVIATLARPLGVDAVLKHPGPLVLASDAADATRVVVFVVDGAARFLTTLPVASVERLHGLAKGTTYGTSGVVWHRDADAFTIWNFDGKPFESRGGSLDLPGFSIERGVVARVASFIGETLGNRGVKLVTPGYKYPRIVIVQDNDFLADDNPSYTRDDARRDGMWASCVGRDLAGWLGVPYDDEIA